MTTGRWRPWVLWATTLVLVSAGLLLLRARLDKAHVALVFLLVVLGGSATGGRALGLLLAGAAFLLFNWFFLEPYGTFVIANPLDWLVLVAFLIVSGVAAQLLHRFRQQADAARRSAAEVDRFATLGAETLNVARADEALSAIADVIRSTLRLSAARIHTDRVRSSTGLPSMMAWVMEHGTMAIVSRDGTTRVTVDDLPRDNLAEARSVYLPLKVRGRTVGVLELTVDAAVSLEAAERRFLAALSYYAALAVERARLAAAADHAEALREAGRMKDVLLASVSHDLRTPLTTIKALAHEMARQDERAQVIEEEADRLNRLVADLLDLSGIQGGALPLAIEVNAVDELVGALVQQVSPTLAGREIEVDLENGGTLLAGRFDFVHTLRILGNLVDNAKKYAPANTPITISARRQGGEIELAVADRGPGVPDVEREQIFEPFYRAPGAPPDVGGTGLGLSIARRLAVVQQGSLGYAARPGGGSVFSLRLPAVTLPTVTS